MASHIAADACKNGGLRAQAFNDAALLTAHRQRSRVRSGLCAAARPARPGRRPADCDQQLRQLAEHRAGARARAATCGCRSSRFPARAPDNPSRRFGDLNFYVPIDRYGWIESAHHVVLHYWLDQYLNVHGQGAM